MRSFFCLFCLFSPTKQNKTKTKNLSKMTLAASFQQLVSTPLKNNLYINIYTACEEGRSEDVVKFFSSPLKIMGEPDYLEWQNPDKVGFLFVCLFFFEYYYLIVFLFLFFIFYFLFCFNFFITNHFHFTKNIFFKSFPPHLSFLFPFPSVFLFLFLSSFLSLFFSNSSRQKELFFSVLLEKDTSKLFNYY